MTKKPSPLPPEVAALFQAWGRQANIPHHQVCAYCGSSYVARRARSRYCRATCRVRAWEQATRETKETS